MTKLRVFPDTGIVLAMSIFPTGKMGRPTLAGEVLNLYHEGFFEFVISQEVVEELLDVIQEEFPHAYDNSSFTKGVAKAARDLRCWVGV